MFIGDCVGFLTPDRNVLRHAALLHDLGKVKIPRAILNKEEPLSSAERRLIKTHPEQGGRILNKPCKNAEIIINAITNHHERYDGAGYPFGLRGEMISVYARIIAVADAFDAMVSPRPYRSGIAPLQEALKEIEVNAGTQFDPYIVKKVADKSPWDIWYGLYGYRRQCLG